LIDQKLVAEPSFSFYLTNSPGSTGSVMILGGIDMKYAAGPFRYVDLIHENYYMVEI